MDPECPVNFQWPKEPHFDNPITSILNDGNTFFTFKVLKEDEVSELHTDGEEMTEHYVLNPDCVRKAVLWWEQEDAQLCGIELYDNEFKQPILAWEKSKLTASTMSLVDSDPEGEPYLRAGWFQPTWGKQEIYLEENERLVGIAGYNTGSASHYHF